MSQKVSKQTLITYSLPGIGSSILNPQFQSLVLAFYAMHTNVTATGIATVLLLTRIFDAITDPVMGYLTDRTNTRFGARKPWIALGAVISVPAVYAVFIPPDDANNTYLLFAFLLFYVSYTMINIPLRSWGSDLSPDYDERSRIATALVMALLMGGLLYVLLPIILSLPWIGMFETAEFNRDMMAVLGVAGMILMPCTLLISVWLTPVGRHLSGQTSSPLVVLRNAAKNKPFLTFLFAFTMSGLAFGSFSAVVLIMISRYFGFSAEVPIFLVMVTLAQVSILPLWTKLSARVDKHLAWSIAWLLHALLLPLIWLMDPAATPFWLFLVYGIAVSAVQAPHMAFALAMLSDIVDYDTLRSKEVRAGSYFSLLSLFNKGANAVGAALAFYLLGWVGYDAKLSTNTEWANFGLLMANNGIPAVLCAISALIMLRYGLTRRKHGIIRRRLALTHSRQGFSKFG